MKKVKQVIKPVLTLIIKLFWMFPVNERKVLFSSYSGRSYSDNPKYIAEKMVQSGKYECVFVLRDVSENVPSSIRTVKYNTLRYLFEVATAKFWVDNTRKQDFIVKRTEQVYIQTWHGSIPLKKIEKDIEPFLDRRYIKTAKNDSSMINFLLTSNDFGKKICENSFWYSGKVVKTGSPRLDRLVRGDKELANNVENRLNLKENVSYVLYAPTFRDNGRTDIYSLNFLSISESLRRRFGGEWKVILRLHPNIADEVTISDNDVINASTYPDVVELYSACKVLITDYSSTMFDFSLTLKPTFLYMPDLKDYQKSRPTYFKLDELPFPTVSTQRKLISEIESFDEATFKEQMTTFFEKLRVLEDGRASERVCRLIYSATCSKE